MSTAPATCAQCKRRFPANGQRWRFCSKACSRKHEYAERRAARRARRIASGRPIRQRCDWCARPLPSQCRVDAQYCSAACRNAQHNARHGDRHGRPARMKATDGVSPSLMAIRVRDFRVPCPVCGEDKRFVPDWLGRVVESCRCGSEWQRPDEPGPMVRSYGHGVAA